MLDAILNNPHYIMYGMIGIFMVVVVIMGVLALNGDLRPNRRRDDALAPPPPRQPPRQPLRSSQRPRVGGTAMGEARPAGEGARK